MKKSLLIIIPALLIAGLATLLLLSIKKYNRHRVTLERISRLPEFSFQTPDSEIFKSSQVGTGPLVLIHFHPECDHCQYEISQLASHMELFRGIKIILVSAGGRELTLNLICEAHIPAGNDIMVLLEKDGEFNAIFGDYPIPAHFLYNKELRLVKVLSGEFRHETILKLLRENEH